MIKRYSVLICVILSLILMLAATWVYPGGSLLDKNSTGFDWTKNFISNLFSVKAMNGVDNPSRFWAIPGMAFHALGYGLFFINMASKISANHAARVLKMIGYTNIFLNILITTRLHDLMIIITSTSFLMGLFYITVYLLRTRLHFIKVCCLLGLLTFYYTLYLYGAGDWALLAIMQKVSLFGSMGLVLGLEYFTEKNDFRPRAN
ncbi:MAG TPA: hypothetical protein PKL70_06510 [Saprospiraceae bacterium]|nr:hypothetical protein [Saprospiraceae bacterium]